MLLRVNPSVSDPNKLSVHVEHWWGPLSVVTKDLFTCPEDSVIQQSPRVQWTSLSVLSSYLKSKGWLQLIHIHILPLMFSPLNRNFTV